MAEMHGQDSFERRCRLANMIVRTRIIEALPTLEPEQWHHIETGLEKHIHNFDEARAYATYLGEVVDAQRLFNVKTFKLSLQLEPPVAKVDIEMGKQPIGYLQGNSVHLFDD